MSEVTLGCEDDCEDQGYGLISDGCVNWGCDRAPIKPDGEWMKCTKCGANYGEARAALERKP